MPMETLDDMARMRKLQYETLRGRGFKCDQKEGSSTPDELLYLMWACRVNECRNVTEIGFNIGCSTLAFLNAHPDVQVTTFDIGKWEATIAGKALIDELYPGRHTMIYGDSAVTVPEYALEHPDACFDLAFIDGNHSYKMARQDLIHMRKLCDSNTVLLMDDLIPWVGFGKGVCRAWQEAIRGGWVAEDILVENGERRTWDTIERVPHQRIWAQGRYLYRNGDDRCRGTSSKTVVVPQINRGASSEVRVGIT